MLFLPFRLAFRLVSLLVFAAVIYVVVSGGQVVNASRLSSGATALQPSSAIVVLGAPTLGNAPGSDLLARLEQTRALYQAHLSTLVLVCGGPGLGANAPTSVVARSWLAAQGVPASAITELSGPDAIAQLKATRAALGAKASVIVVTDAIDALWTKNASSALDLEATISPPPTSKKLAFDELGPLWRQATSVAAGRIIGYSRTTWAA